MSLVEHARRELAALQTAADRDEDGIDEFQRDINESLMRIVATFAEAGHSGSSAGYSIEMLGRLLRFEPITPLTGADGEWMAITQDMVGRPGVEQNVRCGRVFRENGVAYDIDAVVFKERRGGGAFTGWDSKRRITFPYTPTTRYTRWRRFSRLWARVRGKLV